MLLFDIGANQGRWSYANYGPDVKIIAVEGSKKTFDVLSGNLNTLNNITCLYYAVTDYPDEFVSFYEADDDGLSTTNIEWLTNPSYRFNGHLRNETKSPTITLDKLIDQYGLPDFLKIDVEGGEYNCIKSLTKKVPVLCFEWAIETSDIVFDSVNYLTSLGFSKFYTQQADDYTFRPTDDQYYDLETLTNEFEGFKEGDWGMVWCK
jgi:FkbM family methyltransferase